MVTVRPNTLSSRLTVRGVAAGTRQGQENATGECLLRRCNSGSPAHERPAPSTLPQQVQMDFLLAGRVKSVDSRQFNQPGGTTMKAIRSLIAGVLVLVVLASPSAAAGKVCWDDGAGGDSPIGYKC